MDNRTDNLLDLVKRFEGLEAGVQLTLVLTNIFGNPFDFRATYAGVVEQHGYYSKGGGWGLYEIKGMSDIPCYRIRVREYRRRGEIWLQIGQKVIDYRLGW